MMVAVFFLLLFVSAHAMPKAEPNAHPKPKPVEELKNNDKRQLIGFGPTPNPSQISVINTRNGLAFSPGFQTSSGVDIHNLNRDRPGTFATSVPITVVSNDIQPINGRLPGNVVITGGTTPNLGARPNYPVILVDDRGNVYPSQNVPRHINFGGNFPSVIPIGNQGLGFNGGGILPYYPGFVGGNNFLGNPGFTGTSFGNPGFTGTSFGNPGFTGTSFANPGYVIVSANDPRVQNSGFTPNLFGVNTNTIDRDRFGNRRRGFNRRGNIRGGKAAHSVNINKDA